MKWRKHFNYKGSNTPRNKRGMNYYVTKLRARNTLKYHTRKSDKYND